MVASDGKVDFRFILNRIPGWQGKGAQTKTFKVQKLVKPYPSVSDTWKFSIFKFE